MKQFFIKLLSSNSGLSSKRFAMLYSLILLTAVVINAIIKNNITDSLIWGLVTIIGGSAGLTVMDKYKKGDANNDTPPSNEIKKEDQTT